MSLEVDHYTRPTKPKRSPIEIWQYAQKEQINRTNTRRADFTIVNAHIPEDFPISCGSRKMYMTSDQGIWDVYILSSSVSSTESLLGSEDLHHAAQDLVPRQKLRYPVDPVAQIHASVIDFITVNWPVLEPRIHTSPVSRFKSSCLSEVALPDHGQADVIGLCSDGTICVIEVGTNEKPSQSFRYQTGVKELMAGTTMKVLPMVAAYQRTESGMLLQLRELTEAIDRPKPVFAE